MSLNNTQERSLADRSMRWLGALDHPHYDDERNRWVWYEASAIGAQVAIVGGYIAAGIMMLAYGEDVIGPMWIMITPLGIASILMVAHTSRHAAEYAPSLDDVRSSRGLVHFAALAFWLVAYLITTAGQANTSTGFTFGLIFAAALGVGVGVGLVNASKRNNARRAAAQGDPLD